MASNKKYLAIGIVLAICVVVLAAVLFMQGRQSAAAPQNQGGDTVVYAVRSVAVTRETLISYIQSSGDVEATRSIDVYPDMGGKLVRTNVNLGSQVRRGQVIAEVDPSTPGVPYEISPVIAPLSGAITSQPLQPGTTVSQATPVAVIGSIDDLQVTANVPERHAALLHTGMKAEVTLEAYPGVVFPATVVRVSPVVDSLSRTKELQLTFDEQDSRINAGMYAKLRLFTTEKSGVIVVPETSVMTAFGRQYVFVVSADGSKAVQRDVTTGMTVDGRTEVVSGLAEGDRVIVEGMHLLYDGSAIRDVATVSRTGRNAGAETAGAEKAVAGGSAV